MGGADDKREWGVFDPGNVGAYPGRVIELLPGMIDEEVLDVRGSDDRGVSLTTICLTAKVKHTNIDTLHTAFARIAWGIAGGRDEVMVDYLHGQCITVPASYIRTTATYPVGNVNPPGWPPFTPDPEAFGLASPPTVDPVAAELEALQVGANIAPQPHPIAAFGSTPRLSIYVAVDPGTVQAPTPSLFIRVPPHAQSVTVLTNNNIWEPSLVSFHSLQTAASSLYAENQPATVRDPVAAIPIGRGVEYVAIWNTTNATQFAILLWTIGL